MTTVLGIAYYHTDSAACIFRDGQLLAAVEEERFDRIKHSSAFPLYAIKYCLDTAGIDIKGVDHIAINHNPRAHRWRRLLYAASRRITAWRRRERFVPDVVEGLTKPQPIRDELRAHFGVNVCARIHHVEHHLAHMASAFFGSPFSEAYILSIDGHGDHVTTMWGTGSDATIKVSGMVFLPHSLGLFYQAMTQFCGFMERGDEYKMMGLSAFGDSRRMKAVELISSGLFGGFYLNLKYFRHHAEGSRMWLGQAGEFCMDPLFTEHLRDLLHDYSRDDIAAFAQHEYNRGLLSLFLTTRCWEDITSQNICLAGGCALNSVANGLLMTYMGYGSGCYVPPAPHDAGGAVGAALWAWHMVLGKPRGSFIWDRADHGPSYSNSYINRSILTTKFLSNYAQIEVLADRTVRENAVVEKLIEGKVVGWFDGRAEFGPRALGNRSILADPRRPEIKERINQVIKRREDFRPFAPSVLDDHYADWFVGDWHSPFMSQVCDVRSTVKAQIPAVVHVDGTARPQAVSSDLDFYRLINRFRVRTGVPMLLNTSFNENEPIVLTPEQALACFLRTDMDALAIGPYLLSKRVN